MHFYTNCFSGPVSCPETHAAICITEVKCFFFSAFFKQKNSDKINQTLKVEEGKRALEKELCALKWNLDSEKHVC